MSRHGKSGKLHISSEGNIEKLLISICARSCEPGSRCRPNECIFGSRKLRGVRILEGGVYEPGEGNGEVSLQAT